MTRVLIISDIHGNKDALDAVAADAGDAEQIWCLGDVVGYGPEPNACLSWVREHCQIVLAGNHDYAAFDEAITRDFNPNAARAAAWTREQLSEEEIAYLRSLPSRVDLDRITLAHASPADPIWTYILSVVEARDAFGAFAGIACFVGHSHVAGCFIKDAERIARIPIAVDDRLTLVDGRFIINPGAVGQPRDRDPRAAYLWYDDEAVTVTWKRVQYDIERTQVKMLAAGLPERLASRLALGQ
jgi:diadenosine tetraphosphatase ApaH/serine/threonine PP2A family protein phosphatase